MVNMSLIAKQLLIVWRRCFDDFKVVVIKTNIVLIYTNIVDYIFRYVCLKYYRILNRRILSILRRFQMKKVLITGITGQDGSYLAEFLLENNR